MAIFTSIATAIAGALFGGSALAASLIGGALAFGAKLAIGKLTQQKQQKRKYTAVQGEIQFGGDVPVGTLFGVGKTKGQRTFYAKWGSGNKWNAEVFVLANGWCDGLEPYVYIYGEKKALVSRPVIGNEVANYYIEGFVNGSGDPVLTIRFYDGRPGQLVDQKLVDVTAALGNKWKSTSVNAGICYVVVERIYSDKLFGSKGRPELEFVLRGLREYDPRKDSTVAGGSGTQRLNTPSTWVHTKNPAVHRLNYQLGLRALVSGRTLIGEGKSLGQIDLATYFVAMNVCDTLRSNGKKTYECSLFVSGDDDHTEVLKQFDDAMAGYGLNRRGLSGVIPGAPQIPVKDLTAADIPIDRAKDVQFRPSAFERFNHLSGQFTSIESMWNPESLKPVYVNADIAADGRNRQTSIDFLQVTDPDIAQYLLNIRYRQNRMGGKATVPVSRRFGLAVQEGEWITWRGKSWLISEWRADERLRITLVLSETSAAIYDDAGIQPGPIVIPPTPPVNPSLLSTVQNFTVAAGVITDGSGVELPALKFMWTPPEDPTITEVRFFYRVSGATEEYQDQTSEPEKGEYTTTKNVVGGKVYDARATITTVPDRLKTFTAWATTATSTVSGVVAALQNFTQEATAWLRDGVRATILEQQRIARLIAEQDLANFSDKQTLRRELVSRAGEITASYTEAITVATGPGSALAMRIQTVEAKIPTLATASVVDALTARVTTSEGNISSLAGRTTIIENELPNKATVSALSSLTTTVDQQGNTIDAYGLRIDSIEAELPGKASVSAVNSLDARVTTAETTLNGKNRVFRQSTAPNATAVGDLWIHTGESNRLYRASAVGAANWVLSEDQRVPELVTTTTAQATSISSLFAALGGNSAAINVRASVLATPSGYSARYGIEARTGGAGTYRAAAMYLDVPASTSAPTRVVFLADQFVIASGSNLKNPFIFQNGEATLNVANIGTVNAGLLQSPNGKMKIDLNNGTIEIFS